MSALKKCLQIEGLSIINAADTLSDTDVEKVINLMLKCSKDKSKVVLTGVGKSGIVARKIAATFSSIGLVSLYLNPLDALHGDLGIIANNDICFLLSNSGETKELIEIIPHIKRKHISLIGIIGNINSSLADLCTVSLNAGVDREACPLNLAPTASTAVAMAIGDALASVWMERKGISNTDFALNHPSGLLGKKLTLKVRDLMVPAKKLIPLDLDTNLEKIIGIISNNGMGCAYVKNFDKKNKIVGLITDGDLRRALKMNSPQDWVKLKANQIMTKDPLTIDPQVLAIEALHLMENRKKSINVLPVVENGEKEIVGILRLHDIIQSGLK